MNKKEIQLKVREADPNLVGKKIVAIDIDTKKNLGLTHEDYVAIKGKRETIAQVWPARPLDEGSGIIRMDSFTRKNVGVSIGDVVNVRKAEVNESKTVVLAPLQVLKLNGNGYNRLLKKQYMERAITAGEELLFSIFGSPIVLVVQKTIPKGFVKITEGTELRY
jgi:transitional endoplasmic reticulum ATPase